MSQQQEQQKPALIEHVMLVIRVMEDTKSKTFFFTVTREAIRVYTSPPFPTAKAAEEATKQPWS